VTQTITVNDDIDPTASNPAPVNVQCIADVPAPDILVVTDESDNCTANPVVAFVSDAPDGNTCPLVIQRTYSVTDECNNQILVTQTITVNDEHRHELIRNARQRRDHLQSVAMRFEGKQRAKLPLDQIKSLQVVHGSE
jgi:hypothetical protein